MGVAAGDNAGWLSMVARPRVGQGPAVTVGAGGGCFVSFFFTFF